MGIGRAAGGELVGVGHAPLLTDWRVEKHRQGATLACAMELLGRETELASVDRAVQDARAGALARSVCSARPGSGRARCWARCASARRTPGCSCWTAARPSTSAPCRSGSSSTRSTTTSPRCTRGASSRSGPTSPPCCRPRRPRPPTARAERPAAGAAERFRYHRAVRALLELLGARAAGRAAARRPALGRRRVGRARAAPAAPPAARAAPARVRPAPAGARRRGCSTPPAARPAWEHARSSARWPTTAARALRRRRCPTPALRERVVREAGGNPLFLRGAARASRATRPSALPPHADGGRRGSRSRALPPASRALIEGAAVAGDPFDPDLAAARRPASSRGRRAAPLDRLVAADLVRADRRRRARSRSATRSSAAPSTTPRRRPGGSPRTSARPRRSPRAAPAPVARAHHVERYARQGDLDGGRAARRRRRGRRRHRARDRRAPLRRRAPPAARRRRWSAAPRCSARWRSRRAPPAGWTTARDTLDEVLGLLPPEPTPLRVAPDRRARATLEQMLGRHDARRAGGCSPRCDATPPEPRALLELDARAAPSYGARRLRRDARRLRRARGASTPARTSRRSAPPPRRWAALAPLLLGEPRAGPTG